MSQVAEILSYLETGATLTMAEAYAHGWGISLNSRVAEINERLKAGIECHTEKRNGKTVYVYSLPVRVNYG